MRQASAFALVLTMAILGGCKGNETGTTADTPPTAASASTAALTPEQLGELGAQMRKDPARADEILAERGLSREAFEKAIREVTESPDASKRYAEAYRKASA